MDLSRRHFLGCACCAGAAVATVGTQAFAATGPRTTMTPDQALAALKEAALCSKCTK
jgi:hypothetical protein